MTSRFIDDGENLGYQSSFSCCEKFTCEGWCSSS